MASSQTRQFKIALIGDSAVGKTSIRRNFMGQSFTSSHIATLGVDFAQKNIRHEDAPIRLTIWDLAGQHTYESVRKLYYQGTHGLMFVYSIANTDSFENSARWFVEVSKYLRQPFPPIAILANKIDLRESETTKTLLTTKDGEEFVKRFGEKLQGSIIFRETSALTGENIEDVFIELIDLMMEANPL
ncbi:MAG: GTP-binding protein [Candidatus Thorarchaeota archaeon]